MKAAITKLFECVTYYSTELAEFKIIPEVKTKTLKLAKTYTNANYKRVR